MNLSKAVYRSAVRIAVGVALIVSLPPVAMQFSEDVDWSVFDLVLLAVMLTVIGVTIELALKQAGNLAVALGIAALGIAAGVLGEADDAPGLVLIGGVLVLSAFALGVRAAQRTR